LERDVTGDLSVRLLRALDTINSSVADQVIAEWTTRVLNDLSMPCLDWLATSFSTRLAEQHRERICKSLDGILERDAITEDAASRYHRFLSELSVAALAEAPFQEHLDRLFSYLGSQYANSNNYLTLVFPVVPPILKHAKSATAGSFLDTLFTRVESSSPTLLSWLHGEMVAHWPDPSPELAPYDPNRLFSGAVETARQNANNQLVIGLLQSLEDMLGRGVVGAERSAEFLEIAMTVWPHFPEEVVQTLNNLPIHPSPSQAAKLAGGVDLESPGRSNLLREAWLVIAQRMSVDERIETAKGLLSEPLQGPPDEPDRSLRLWFDAQESGVGEILRSLLSNRELNDEQIKRVWLQSERRADTLGRAFFSDVLPPLMVWSEGVETSRSIFSLRDTISRLLKSEDERFQFGFALLNSLPNAPTLEVKNDLARWLHNIGARGVLGQINDVTGITHDDVEILERYFGKIPEIRGWKSRHKLDS
jgi:hypothetical protein